VNARMWADPSYRADAEALLAVCAQRDLGVMAIKAVARKPWDDGERSATTWYEPFDSPDEIAQRVAFTLSVPGVHAFCTPGDEQNLKLALAGAETFDEPMGTDERDAMIDEARSLPSIFPIPA
jgi:hypothetical protein